MTACGWATPFVFNMLADAGTPSDILWVLGAFFVAYAINEGGTVSIGDEAAIPNAVADQARLDRRAAFVVTKGS